MGKIKKRQQGLDGSAVQWADKPVPAAEFMAHYDLPQVVKLHSGEYGNFGCGTEVDVSQPFLLHTQRDCEKVLAENVMWDNDREQFIDTGVQIIIPTNYPGWFAVGSHTSKKKLYPWTSVADIPLKTTKSILATHPVSCFKLSERTLTGDKLYLKRDYTSGEEFQVGDLYIEKITTNEPTCCLQWVCGGEKSVETMEEVEYVLSKDSGATDVLLPVIAKGAFYKVGIAEQNDSLDQGSVYGICDIIGSSDFPCYVNLVYGKAPQSLSTFSGTVRLEEVYKEDTVVACSMGSCDFNLLEFPMDSGLEFIPAKNNAELLHHIFVQNAIEYCLDNVMPYIISLKVIQNFFSGNPSSVLNLERVPSRRLPEVLHRNPPQSSSSSQQESSNIDTDKSGIFTSEDETISQSGESHYETIPYDHSNISNNQQRLGHSSSQHDTMAVLDIPPRQTFTEFEDTGEYLVPAHMRKQSVYTNVGNGDLNIHRSNTQNFFSNQPTGVVCPANSINEEDEKVYPSFLTDNKPFVLQRLPSGGRERMDRFLQDSLEELNRIRSSCSECDDGILKEEKISQNGAAAELKDSQSDEGGRMKATLDAFLEEIFDCQNLEKGQVSSNIESIVRSKDKSSPLVKSLAITAQEPESIKPTSVSNFKSLSALDLADNGATPYVSNSVCSADAKCPTSKDIQSPPYPGIIENENTSSSSRSASSIYRQMKYASYSRSDSCPMESLYPRTDSGIFVTPGYSVSESGYNKGIYQAMSQVSWTPPDDISTLSVEEVSLSLIYIGIKQKTVDLFFDQLIDGQQLLGMDETLLKEGFPEMNSLERKKVLDFLKGWRPKKLS